MKLILAHDEILQIQKNSWLHAKQYAKCFTHNEPTKNMVRKGK